MVTLGGAAGCADEPTGKGLLAGSEHRLEILASVPDAQDRELARIPLEQECLFEIGRRPTLQRPSVGLATSWLRSGAIRPVTIVTIEAMVLPPGAV